MSQEPPPWQPRSFLRFVRGLSTSMQTAQIVTDQGEAYIKAMGNPEGPHALACEWVGTQLAHWLGLPTFDISLLSIGDRDEIPFRNGGRAAPGPAFVARRVSGHSWGGTEAELRPIVNPEAISLLVVFDTWTLNCDRHPADLSRRNPNPDNVFLSDEGLPDGSFRLMAMDQTHCFTCGRDLGPRLAEIDQVRDERVYGLFPQFEPLLQRTTLEEAKAKLLAASGPLAQGILGSVPLEWDVSETARQAWEQLICSRARFVAENMIDPLIQRCPSK